MISPSLTRGITSSDRVAASLGFTQIVLWNATLGDSIVHPLDFLQGQVQRGAANGTIFLGHANHRPTADGIEALVATARSRGVALVTLPELIGPDGRHGTSHWVDPATMHEGAGEVAAAP